MTTYLGLTGSIGMGKSTTAQMFRDENIPVHDADATVHALYEGEAASLIEAEFSGTVIEGKVDRQKLARQVVGNEAAMKRLEAIIHPLVRREELEFRSTVEGQNTSLAILDIPLLFETDSQDRVDGIIVVTAPYEIQRERVLARVGMNEKKFLAILDRQYPDSDKQAKADFVIDTSKGLEAARSEVKKIIKLINSNNWQSGKNSHA